ncbi:pfs domain-containing [Trichoderma arundinaceum]|uniref:Pfs domain-containing n=1 Tax=Trichoderma arundinaceum TaxID=490622 RepID=A0A395N8G3_TRIAR|nr:pfs domain-containing [Trichoderma arundinaceum]
MSLKEYTIGWICTREDEFVAAQAIIEEQHDTPGPVAFYDSSRYAFGRIGKHNVVVACLAEGRDRAISEMAVLRNMQYRFSVRFILMVGVGGGAPSQENDIRLGDIMVGMLPSGEEGGAVLYDVDGTIHTGMLYRRGIFNRAPTAFLSSEENILCFETGAKNPINGTPCLAIRGICDYSDSHANEEWQGYAAMAAAVYARQLLCKTSPDKGLDETSLAYAIPEFRSKLQNLSQDGLRQRNPPTGKSTGGGPDDHGSRPNFLTSLFDPTSVYSGPQVMPSSIPSKDTPPAIWPSTGCFIFHQTTLVGRLLVFSLLSGMMVVVALQQTREPVCDLRLDALRTDDGFWTLLSQLFLQVLSIFCTLYPVVLNHELKVPVTKFWSGALLAISFATAVVAVVTYSWSWKAATVLSFVTAFAQVISAGQLAVSLNPDGRKGSFIKRKTSSMEDGHED